MLVPAQSGGEAHIDVSAGEIGTGDLDFSFGRGESRGAFELLDEGIDGVGISRLVQLEGESGELDLDISVGLGKAELRTVGG